MRSITGEPHYLRYDLQGTIWHEGTVFDRHPALFDKIQRLRRPTQSFWDSQVPFADDVRDLLIIEIYDNDDWGEALIPLPVSLTDPILAAMRINYRQLLTRRR